MVASEEAGLRFEKRVVRRLALVSVSWGPREAY